MALLGRVDTGSAVDMAAIAVKLVEVVADRWLLEHMVVKAVVVVDK